VGRGTLSEISKMKDLQMTFNQLLTEQGIDLTTVMVLRHRPTEPQLRKVLPWLAAEKPVVFNAYQQAQGARVEKALQKSKYVASFIGSVAGKATFVGLYKLHDWQTMTIENLKQLPAMAELYTFGMKPSLEDVERTTALWFNLHLTDLYANWKGKLIIQWPGKELSWWRWADRNTFAIHAIREESAFDAAMPQWNELVLSWEELHAIPTPWKHELRQWRGIYFIFETALGKGYVGSAYGSENILGRWINYAASGHGGNQLLKKRDPKHFLFSILQRLSPDSLPEEVIQCENSWKERLHTRAPMGLNDN
jgi:hypothetical protein